MILQASIQIQTRFRPEHRARSHAMRVLLNLLTALVRCTLAFFRSRNGQAIIELALRQQLATYALEKTRPRLTPLDRAFWVALLRFWPRWKEVLVIVKPDTVVRWHRGEDTRASQRLPARLATDLEARSRATTTSGGSPSPHQSLRTGKRLGSAEGPCRAWEARLHHEPRNRLVRSPQDAARPRQTAALGHVS